MEPACRIVNVAAVVLTDFKKLRRSVEKCIDELRVVNMRKNIDN